MSLYLLRRVGQSLILLVLVSLIGFALIHLAPGGPLAQFTLTPGMSSADLARIAHQMGLDRPLPVQYWEWFRRLLVGDWGLSYRDNQPVLAVIGAHVPATLELMISSTLIAVLIGTWVGVLGALRRYSIFDYLATIGAMIALSLPTFWFGLVVIYAFSVKLGWLPAGGMYTCRRWVAARLCAPSDRTGDECLALVTVAIWSRYMRSSMLEVTSQDFVRTATAKGLPRRVVIIRHALRNALLPMITLMGATAAADTAGRRAGHRDDLHLAGDGTAFPRFHRLSRLPGGDGAADVHRAAGADRQSHGRHALRCV